MNEYTYTGDLTMTGFGIIDAVRKRPHMYIPKTPEDQGNMLIHEAICPMLKPGDRQASKISIGVDSAKGAVLIMAQGASWDLSTSKWGRPVAEDMLINILYHPSLWDPEPEAEEGLLGPCTITAASEMFDFSTMTGTQTGNAQYIRGAVSDPFLVTECSLDPATLMRFAIDRQVLPDATFDYVKLVQLLAKLADVSYVTSGTTTAITVIPKKGTSTG